MSKEKVTLATDANLSPTYQDAVLAGVNRMKKYTKTVGFLAAKGYLHYTVTLTVSRIREDRCISAYFRYFSDMDLVWFINLLYHRQVERM